MNNLSHDISVLLVEDPDLNLTAGGNLFVGREPTSPPNTVTLFDSPGGGPAHFYDREERYEYGAIQVRVRDTHYGNGLLRARAISKVLDGISGIEIDGALYTRIRAIDNPSLLGYDDNNRAWIVFNLETQRRPLPQEQT